MTLTKFANPFLRCDSCREHVDGATNLDSPGLPVNQPCGHTTGSTSECPSWSPVDGCRCPEQLGERRHTR